MTLANSPAVAELRESPFFVLNGPGGRRLSCQWTDEAAATGGMSTGEFEIVCPETPDAMGCLFGLFDPRDGSFRMRPAIRTIVRDGAPHVRSTGFAPDLDLDQTWVGSMDDVLEVGHDWDMGPDGLLVISDPEAPADEPMDELAALLAAA
jgi:hypothetical protein